MKSFLIFLFLSLLIAPPSAFPAKTEQEARGLWVECEGTEKTLSSRVKIDQLIERAASSGFNLLFVQIYRHDRAWFNSRFADTTPYRRIVKDEQIDPLSYLIQKADQAGLEVHAWMNMFRIGKDRKAPVIKRLGAGAVTRDGHGKSLLTYPSAKLPDGGYWLDPGDKRVQEYLRAVISEVIRKYPGIDGVHLDFTRYPYNSPYAGSLWAKRNDLGYGRESVRRFKEWTGLDPLKMELTRSNCQAWDNWRRYQLNSFVESVYGTVGKLNPKLKVSVAVVAWPDRAYLSSFQDWRRWLEEGSVDFVGVMNYSTDSRLARYLTWGALAAQKQRQAYIGLGAYLLSNDPKELLEQISDCRKAGAPGIVLFSYDSLCQTPQVFPALKKGLFRRPAAVPAMPWKE